MLIDHTQVSVEINENGDTAADDQAVDEAVAAATRRPRTRSRPGPKSKTKFLPGDYIEDDDEEIKPKPKRKRKSRAKPKIKEEPVDGENPPEVKVKVKAKRKRWVPKLVPMNPNDPQSCNFCSESFENWRNFARHVEDKHKDKMEERKRLKVIVCSVYRAVGA